MTTTMIALEIAITVDVFINYSTPVYVIVLTASSVAFCAYYISDAVFQAGCFGVANKYPSVAYGCFWYSLFVKKLKFKNSKNFTWREDLSSLLILLPLSVFALVVGILNASIIHH